MEANMTAATYRQQILSPKYGQTGNVKPLTANCSLSFAVKWSNLGLKASDISTLSGRRQWKMSCAPGGSSEKKNDFNVTFPSWETWKKVGIKKCQFHSIVQVDNNFYFLCLLDHRKDAIMYNIQTLQWNHRASTPECTLVLSILASFLWLLRV